MTVAFGRWSLFVLMVVAAIVGQPVMAGSVEDDVKRVVETNTAILVEKLNREKEHYKESPERFYSEMDSALSEVVDFKRIAARVMGKYARQSSKEQRARFLESFKRSLYVAYSQALVESGAFEISVESATLNPRSDSKASVDLLVTSSSGNQYPVVYSMYLAKNSEWMLENVIVNGVNVGLAFRDRFNQEMREQKGDVDKVIDNWSAEIDSPVAEQVDEGS